MSDLRRDAARNRARILDAARAMRADGRDLQLNALARESDVGVGTVYRHFTTTDELSEALALPRFDELEALAASVALDAFLVRALSILVEDPDFAATATRNDPALEETADARARLIRAITRLLDSAAADGARDDALTSADILVIVCGLAYAIRRTGAERDRAMAYLGVLLRGLGIVGTEGTASRLRTAVD